jgi:hypothetical protein
MQLEKDAKLKMAAQLLSLLLIASQGRNWETVGIS